jgi:LmbE family N-acetylglucosaminyl deacetylase
VAHDAGAQAVQPHTSDPVPVPRETGRTILGLFAHPDDETFGSGAAFAKETAAGARLVLAYTTRGEVGEISDPTLATPETLGAVREQEMRCAAAALGAEEPVFLGYRDSGMAGTAENADPRAYVNAPASFVIRQLVALIRAVRPQVIVTFDPTGAYGHPDHIAIHQHALAALPAAADPGYAPEAGAPWQAKRLCYIAVLRSSLRAMRDALADSGEDVAEFDELIASGAGLEDDQVHIAVEAAGFVSAKMAAFECHRTQFGGDDPFARLPQEVMTRLLSTDYFAIGWPEPPPGTLLAGLFDGLES